MRVAILLVVAAFLGGCSSATRSSGAGDNAHSFIVMLGADTLGAEQYTRSGSVITGDFVNRAGGTIVTHYVIALDANERPMRVELSQMRADSSRVPNGIRSLVATWREDSITVVTTRDTAVTRRFAARNVFPTFGNAMAFYDVAIAAHKRGSADSTAIQFLPLTAARLPNPAQVAFIGQDSVRIWNGATVQYLQLDANRKVLGFSGRATTQKIEIRRVSSFDLGLIAAAFAMADAGGKGPVLASGRDTVTEKVDRANIWVDYGRPRARGRDVFSNGVLGDTLWRTGANAATQFRTDVDLEIAGQTIPAGTYTLFMAVPRDNSRYTLIFNKQVGQWGTEHRPAQDLARVPLTVSRLNAPIDEFTIDVQQSSNGGTLSFLWGNTRLSTPFRVK